MSLRSYEALILRELQRQPGCSRLRQKDIAEWSTGEITPQAGEIVVHLTDEVNVWVAYYKIRA